MIVVMKRRWSCKLIWSIVEGTGFNGQVVGLQDKMICRITSVARLEKVGVGVGVKV